MSLGDRNELLHALISDAKVALGALSERASGESLYGFAIFTDDSFCGFDAAVNSIEGFERRVAHPQISPFESFYFTTEWEFEGGVADQFSTSSDIAETAVSRIGIEGVQDVMIEGMEQLLRSHYFDAHADEHSRLVLAAVTDSDHEAGLFARSIERLNSGAMRTRYERDLAEHSRARV